MVCDVGWVWGWKWLLRSAFFQWHDDLVRTNILYLNIDRGGTKTILGPAGALRAPAGKKEWLCNFSLAVPLFHHQWIIKNCRHCYIMGLTEAQPIIPCKVLWPILSTCIYMYIKMSHLSACTCWLPLMVSLKNKYLSTNKWAKEGDDTEEW